MDIQTILQKLLSVDVISREDADRIALVEKSRDFSVHWELRSMLSIGILLFGSGITILIYNNIDSIGHHVIIALISTVTACCFFYAFKYNPPYQNRKVVQFKKLADYVLLLGCVSFLVLEGYVQFQYKIFGERYGLAVLIPTVIFFVASYYFDHQGVLSMAITGLASWLGLTLSPSAFLSQNDFTQPRLLVAAILLGFVLCVIGWISEKSDIKSHFSFTYFLTGGNLAAFAALSGSFIGTSGALYIPVGLACCAFLIFLAREEHSLLFLLTGIIFGYALVSSALIQELKILSSLILIINYFLFSSVAVLYLLFNYKKILRKK